MIFAMDELGYENNEKIKSFRGSAQKWAFIAAIARGYGFDGIHVTPSLYRSFGLDASEMPDDFAEFHLTYHLGGLQPLLTAGDCARCEKELDEAFSLARRRDMRDISIHPPIIEGMTAAEKGRTEENLSQAIDRWTNEAEKLPFTLSLETHLYEPYFLFGDYARYKRFAGAHPRMGILIDISHNFYSGYGEQDIIDAFAGAKVTGLHVSDALHQACGASLAEGTHLAIGDGAMDCGKIIRHFATDERIFAALEIKAESKKLGESLRLMKQANICADML